MSETKYSKREFIKLLGLGTAGLFFWQCYQNENKVKAQKTTKSNMPPTQMDLELNSDDIILLSSKDSNYSKYKQGFNKRISKLPKYIALCQTEKGVQQAILFAKKEKLTIAVKSGGHSFEGFSSNDDGLVINVSLMKKIKWEKDNQITLEPGLMLKEVYDNLLPKGKLIPAGSCGTVGISGLALGGGYGFFARKYGLSCDNLTAVRMVDGEGNILDSASNSKLLWANQGGGNGNFGVVTSLTFKTYTAPKGFNQYRLKFKNIGYSKLEKIIIKWFEITENIPEEAFSAFVLNRTTLTILVTHFGPNFQELISQFAELTQLSDTSKSMPDQPIAEALKKYYGLAGPVFFKNASAGYYSNFSDISESLSAIFDQVSTSGLIYQINTLGGKINHLNPEDTAYPHRNFNYLSELQAYWEEPSQEKKLTSAFQNVQNILWEAGIRTQYRNYPSLQFKSWESAYYGNNYNQLQKLKAEWDPENRFSYQQSIKA